MGESELEGALKIIRTALLADSDVSGAIEARVYGDFAWVNDDGTTKMPSVVLEPYGGHSRHNRRLQEIDLYINVFSKVSSGEASAIYDKVYRALQGQRLTSEALDMHGVARELARPDAKYEASMRAWYRRGRWRILVTG